MKWSILDAMLIVMSSEYIMPLVILSCYSKFGFGTLMSALMTKKTNGWNFKVTCTVPGISISFSMSTN